MQEFSRKMRCGVFGKLRTVRSSRVPEKFFVKVPGKISGEVSPGPVYGTRLDSGTVRKGTKTHAIATGVGIFPPDCFKKNKNTLHSRNVAYPARLVHFLLIGCRQFRCREPVTKKQLLKSPFFLASTVISGIHAVRGKQK